MSSGAGGGMGGGIGGGANRRTGEGGMSGGMSNGLGGGSRSGGGISEGPRSSMSGSEFGDSMSSNRGNGMSGGRGPGRPVGGGSIGRGSDFGGGVSSGSFAGMDDLSSGKSDIMSRRSNNAIGTRGGNTIRGSSINASEGYGGSMRSNRSLDSRQGFSDASFSDSPFGTNSRDDPYKRDSSFSGYERSRSGPAALISGSSRGSVRDSNSFRDRTRSQFDERGNHSPARSYNQGNSGMGYSTGGRSSSSFGGLQWDSNTSNNYDDDDYFEGYRGHRGQSLIDKQIRKRPSNQNRDFRDDFNTYQQPQWGRDGPSVANLESRSPQRLSKFFDDDMYSGQSLIDYQVRKPRRSNTDSRDSYDIANKFKNERLDFEEKRDQWQETSPQYDRDLYGYSSNNRGDLRESLEQEIWEAENDSYSGYSRISEADLKRKKALLAELIDELEDDGEYY
mmetsp:Transcript_34252/g.65750  ORF Transcript_34252/g.65750 Transcript_34252/m.65750 type:complete len:448 (+) Transcript_34252:3-1346(+)